MHAHIDLVSDISTHKASVLEVNTSLTLLMMAHQKVNDQLKIIKAIDYKQTKYDRVHTVSILWSMCLAKLSTSKRHHEISLFNIYQIYYFGGTHKYFLLYTQFHTLYIFYYLAYNLYYTII